MRLQLVSVVLLSLIAVAGCGGDGEDTFASPQAIADEIGCNYQGGSDELFVKEGGSCGNVSVYTFKDNATRDKYVEAASSFGGTYLVGDKWVIRAESAAPLQKARDKVGGRSSRGRATPSSRRGGCVPAPFHAVALRALLLHSAPRSFPREPPVPYEPPAGWVEPLTTAPDEPVAIHERFHVRRDCALIRRAAALRQVDRPYSAARCSRCAKE
jgi:hypothetical protein